MAKIEPRELLLHFEEVGGWREMGSREGDYIGSGSREWGQKGNTHSCLANTHFQDGCRVSIVLGQKRPGYVLDYSKLGPGCQMAMIHGTAGFLFGY